MNTSTNEANPYAATTIPTAASSEAADVRPNGLTEKDVIELRLSAQRARQRSARFEMYILPGFVLLVALYQFWMCWKVSQSSGTSFGELLSHDGAGFPAASYEGGLVRMFDRLVSGFCMLMASGFLFFIMRAGRKRDLQNARIHDTMLNAGLISRDPKSAGSGG